MRHWIIAGAGLVALAACNDPTTGGNVANGDASNHAWKSPDAERAGTLNPTGSDSGPWVSETGLNETTTGVEDREGEGAAAQSGSSLATPERAAAARQDDTLQSVDERAKAVPVLEESQTR